MPRSSWIALLAFVCCCLTALSSQTVTGTITGTVVDPHHAVMPGLSVKLVSESTGVLRQETTDQRGEFTFNAVQPDAYTLSVEHIGFKRYDKKNLVVNPSDHLSAGEIQLALGDASESVQVIAEGAAVQTASSERSGIITSEQVQNLTIINRDFSVLASLQPGVVYNPGAEAQSFSSNSQFNVNGHGFRQNNITIDGVPVENSNGGNYNTFISMDAIDQVKVQSGQYQAEFGRKAGGAIQATTKAGGSQYHGAMYWYQRNNIFDALQSFAKTNAKVSHALNPSQPLVIPDPRYRFITAGANIGGPVYIPKLIPRDQKKLFFFLSEEQQREDRPQSVNQVTVPTLLERQGNFSLSAATLNANGTYSYGPLAVTDPTKSGLTCKKAGDPGCFPGGIIPPTSINPATQAYLNLLPPPNSNQALVGSNLVNAGGTNFNYQVQESVRIPKHTETLRVDYNPTASNFFYMVLSRWWDDEKGFNVNGGNASWGWLPSEYNPISRILSINAQHIFSPTLILEVGLRGSHWTEGDHPTQALLNTRNRSLTGATLPQLFPQNNPFNLAPNATFGGINNAANPLISNFYPINGTENVFIFNPILTKVFGTHTGKTGLYIEYWQEHKDFLGTGNFVGTYNFSSNSSQYTTALGNTGNAYSNALIGDFQSYTEDSTRPSLVSHFKSIEWFMQDSWKATRNLTLDLGVRLGWSRPFYNARGNEAGFVPERYDPTQRVILYGMPGAPTTPPGASGAIVPGRGNPVDGTVTNGIVPGFASAFDPNYPPGLRNSDHVKTAPRFGFSYDPFGDGKTAIRGGFGLYYDFRDRDNFNNNDYRSFPLQFTPNIEFGQGLGTVNPSVTNYLFPSSSFSYQRNRKIPYSMDYSFGVQREIGLKTVLDLAYVATLSRHQLWQLNLNAIPVNSTINPATRGLPTNALRSYTGYADLNQLEYVGTSSYHSLQAAVNRRFTKTINFGAAYTWSKALDYADNENSSVLNPQVFPNVPFRQWQHGLAGYDRTHIFKASWTYDLPKVSRLWDNGFVRGLLDDWKISGITTLQSGAPSGISLNNVCVLSSGLAVSPATMAQGCPSSIGVSNSGSAWSGSPTEAARVLIVGTGNVGNVTTPFAHTSGLNGFVLAPPVQGTLATYPTRGVPGDAPRVYFRGPGLHNWDMALFKQIPLPSERFKLRFRAEAYNVFNHTQFTSTDTNAQFQVDSRGNVAQYNPTFGKFTNAALKRRLQLALRLAF